MDLLQMGKKIKAERKRQKITLEELAEKISISRNFLWEIEAGRKSPSLQTLFVLSKYLNISVNYLMGLTQNIEYISENGNVNNFKMDEAVKLISSLNDKEISLIIELLKTYRAQRDKL